MIELDLDDAGLTRSRFAVSVTSEAVNSLEALLRPARTPHLHTWVAATRRQLDPQRFDSLLAVLGQDFGYVPDFLTPGPTEYEPTLDAELDAIERVSPDVVAAELAETFHTTDGSTAGLPRAVAIYLDRGGEAALVARLTEQLRCYVGQVFTELWPAARHLLDEDVRDRAVAASQLGFGSLISGLDRSVSWDGRRVRMSMSHQWRARAGDGVVLAPSVFLPRTSVCIGSGVGPMIGYAARGRGVLFTERHASRVTPLLSSRLVTLLADLELSRSTTDLAARHQLSPATVSYHLGRLHRAGLLSRRRDGYQVLYRRNRRADELLDAVQPKVWGRG
jgi:DNA-binding transcriptional ArsR family regulator